MKAPWRFWRRNISQDFSDYLPRGTLSSKEKLLAECKRHGVSIFVDDKGETGSGVYAALRPVAAEAELQARLVGVISLELAARAHRIAWLALLVGLTGLVVAVAK